MELEERKTMHPIARAFLEGVYDDESPLRSLRGLWLILRQIWRHLTRQWREAIEMRPPDVYVHHYREKEGALAFLPFYTPVGFPGPQDLNINMMPFVLSDNFKQSKLPEYLREYHETFVKAVLGRATKKTRNSIAYITVQENLVKAGESQRRPGLHTERPGIMHLHLAENGDNMTLDRYSKGNGTSVAWHLGWGRGVVSISIQDSFRLKGGIYMASSVPATCRLWDCKITDDSVIGVNGNLEPLRPTLDAVEAQIIDLSENMIYWMTDRTPHESLPVTIDTYRQYVRIVTGEVTVWFEDHSTPNPNGLEPDPETTIVVKGSKFSPDSGSLIPKNPDSPLIAKLINTVQSSAKRARGAKIFIKFMIQDQSRHQSDIKAKLDRV